jgi:hypothetical protein
MFGRLLTSCFALVIGWNAFADLLTAPDAEAVYGGKIKWIDSVSTGSTTSRVFVTTDSANSMFYADVDHNKLDQEKFSSFQGVTDLIPSKVNTEAGKFGNSINQFAVDEASGFIFFTNQKDYMVYRCSTASGSLLAVSGSNQVVYMLEVYAGRLYYLSKEGGKLVLHFGTIDAEGNYKETGNVAIRDGVADTDSFDGRIIVNDANNFLYVMLVESPVAIYHSSDAYDNLNSATTFTTLNVDPLAEKSFTAFGIAPGGRVFAGGGDDSAKHLAYTDDNGGNWSLVDIAITGGAGTNIVATTTDNTDNYKVYFGNAISTQRGESDSWKSLPTNIASDQISDSGFTMLDSKDEAIVFASTRGGAGAATDGGGMLYDISSGIMGVHFSSMMFSLDINSAWSVTDSGVRNGTGLGGTTRRWAAFFPDKGKSTYNSVAVMQSQDVSNTLYVGTDHLYRSTNSGSTWNTIFSISNYSGFESGSYVSAIGISPLDGKTVVIGINSSSPKAGNGRIFYTNNALSDTPVWNELDTGTIATEVKDILWLNDSSGGTVDYYSIFVACEYVKGTDKTSYGVKKLSYNSHTGEITVAADMTGPDGLITDFGANKLAIDSLGNVYASGVTVSGSDYTPAIYIYENSGTYWIKVKNDGLTLSSDRSLAANNIQGICIGKNASNVEVPYISIGADIYFYQNSQWVRTYSYPGETVIYSLNWWDDNAGDPDFGSSQNRYKLAVGTDHGLYTQQLNNEETSVVLKMVVNPNNSGQTEPTGIWAVTQNVDYTIKATPASGYNFVGWEVSDGSATVADMKATETTAKLLSDAILTARFAADTKGEGDIMLNKLTIQLSQDYKDNGVKDIFRDTIKIDATLPEGFPYDSLTESFTMWVDSFGVVSEQAMIQKNGKRPVYTLKSNTASKISLTINNVNDKRSLKLTVTKGAAFSTVNPSDGISLYLAVGGKFYFNNFSVDEKTTWKYKGIPGDGVIKLSGTYTKKDGETEGKDKFTISGENIVRPNTKDFDFDDVKTTLQLNQASWTSDKGDTWKRDTYKSPKGLDPKVQMKIVFDRGTWSAKISKAIQGRLVATVMGEIKVDLFCIRDDGVTWSLISQNLKRESPLVQKTKLTLPKVIK